MTTRAADAAQSSAPRARPAASHPVDDAPPARPPARAQVPVKAELSARLAQYGSRFASSATVQVQALQYLAERAKEGRAPKGKAAMAVSYALTGAVRTAGSGNLQSFASYTTGPYSANFMLANDRDLPESAAATGQPPPTLRLQPKITFDIDL